MATLSCPRCGQPRSAHTPCAHCGAPGLTTEVPPLPDVAIPEEATSLPAPIVLPSSVPVAARPQRSETLGRMGYLVAAALSAVGLIFFYGAVWGDHDAHPETPIEERADVPRLPEPPTPPEPPAPPAAPDVPRPPGMSDSDWLELQRDLREAQREVEQATREAQREVEQAAREARRAADEARRR